MDADSDMVESSSKVQTQFHFFFSFSGFFSRSTRITHRSNFKMTCKTVLITGANSGIGFLATQRLVKMGRKVLVACRSSEKARETAKRTGAFPIETPLELNNIDSVRNFANHVVHSEYSDELDTIVHNAGVFLSEDAKDTLKINAVSPVYLSSLLSDLKHLKRTVCVITSPQAQDSMGLPCPGDLEGTRTCTGILAQLKTYIHSKQVLSCAMTYQARDTNQKLVLLAPGAVDTGIHRKLRSSVNFMTRALLYFQSFKYHGTPEWAAGSLVRAIDGEFDPEIGCVSVADLGKLVTAESYVTDYNSHMNLNRSIYELLLEVARK